MAKIILKNASTCVNPILIKVQHAASAGSDYPVGTPVIIFFIQNQTVNYPATIFFEYSLNGGVSWSLLDSRASQLVGTNFSLGNITIPPVGTLCRVRVVNTSCGERISNSLNSVF